MKKTNKGMFKKVLTFFIVITLCHCVISFAVSAVVYKAVFSRYEGGNPVTEGMAERVTFGGEDGIELCGYLFGSKSQSLIIIAPGFHASCSDYTEQAQTFANYGFDVMVFDSTGSGESGGEDYVGFARELSDLKSCIDFAVEKYCYEDIFLFGHSRGGWAVCSLEDSEKISGRVSVGGINSPMEAIIMPAYEKVGPIAYGNYPFLYLYQVMLFGDSANISAAEVLSKTKTPTLIIHAEDDKQVPPDKYSVMAHSSEVKSENVEFLLWEDCWGDGHTEILFDSDGSSSDELMKTVAEYFTDISNSEKGDN